MDESSKKHKGSALHRLRGVFSHASRFIRRDINRRAERVSGKEEDVSPEENLSDDCGIVLQELRNVWSRQGWSWTEHIENDGTTVFISEDSVIRIDPKTVKDVFFSKARISDNEIEDTDVYTDTDTE